MEDLHKYNAPGTITRAIQDRMLEIVIEVDAILRKHHIEYWLDGGTLLGAVRHGGFIPWDDDLDINVQMKDMPLVRKVLTEELPNNYIFHDAHNDPNYHLLMAKVRDMQSLFEDPYCSRHKYQGIYIDIIPMEEVVPIGIKNKIDFVYIRCLRGMHNYSDRILEKILGYICYPFTLFITFLCRTWTRLFPTKMWGHAYGWLSYAHIKVQDIFPTKDIEFEGLKLRAPANPDGFLRSLFGDYMQVPPPEKRITHNAKVTFFN